MSKMFLALLFGITVGLSAAAAQPLTAAHAHNDYEHEVPLQNALEAGFTSVEADVFLIDGELYVYHNKPRHPDPGRTLRALYLDPLKRRVAANGGGVYPQFDGVFYLMIDLKTKFEPTYELLHQQLLLYEPLFFRVVDGIEEADRPVKVFLSGTASKNPDVFRHSSMLLAAVDGRPEHLGQGFSPAVMPVVSQRFSKVVSWRGRGEPSLRDWNRLRELVQAAHAEDKRVRLWAAPDHERGWQFLKDAGVDLINTDDLSGLSQFLRASSQVDSESVP